MDLFQGHLGFELSLIKALSWWNLVEEKGMFCLSQQSEVSQRSPGSLKQVMAGGSSLGGPPVLLIARSEKRMSALPPSVTEWMLAQG